MDANTQRIYEEALSLPEESKVDLAEKLIENIETNIDPRIAKAHIQEAIKRRDEIREDKVRLIPADEALKCVRNLVCG